MHDLGFASWTRRNFSLVKWTLLKQLMIFEGLSIRKWYCTNLISDSSAFSKFSLNIWKFTLHVPLKPSLENLSITFLACEMSTIERYGEHSLGLTFFGTGTKTDLFQSCGHC